MNPLPLSAGLIFVGLEIMKPQLSDIFEINKEKFPCPATE